MDAEEFRKNGYEMVDYLVDYIESISQRRVTPDVPDGYLVSAMPSVPPEKRESFQKIMEDIEKYILPGLTQYQHPGYHAFFPASGSYAATLGNMMADIFSFVSFYWNYSPSSCELEVIITNWYGKMIGLPSCFLYCGDQNRGAGIMQRSTNECMFLCMVTARRQMLSKLQHMNPSISRAVLLSSLVAYCSKYSHSSMEKIALATLVNVRVLDTDGENRLRGRTLAKAMECDRRIGLIPFFVNVTIGTFSNGSSDPIDEIGPVCQRYGVWLNVDAGYGGNALVCPEYRHLLQGVEDASSFIVSPELWMLLQIEASLMFVVDRYRIRDSVVLDRTIFGYTFGEKDWSYPCRTENHSLKYYFVMRNYGLEGMQKHVRNHVHLAELFEDLVTKDERFEFLTRNFGIVCFRLKASDGANNLLNKSINSSGRLFMTPTRLGGRYTLRFVLCRGIAKEDDVSDAWEIIQEKAGEILANNSQKLSSPSSKETHNVTHNKDLP